MRYLITQSLISSWAYAMDSGDEDRFEDFRKTLRREPVEKSEAMENGIAFENQVYEVCQGLGTEPFKKWDAGTRAVADIIKGGQLQVADGVAIGLPGIEFYLYGIADCIKAGTIYDVKFSSKSFGSAELAGKYLASVQHPAYFQIWQDAQRFVYVVSDGEDIYTEEYTRRAARPFWSILGEWWSSMQALGLSEEYKKHWEARS